MAAGAVLLLLSPSRLGPASGRCRRLPPALPPPSNPCATGNPSSLYYGSPRLSFDPIPGGGALLRCGRAHQLQQRRLPSCCSSAGYVAGEDCHALFTGEDDTWEDCVLIHKIRKLGSSTIKLRRQFSPTQSPDHCSVFMLNIWLGIFCRDLKP
uniref:Uncharacterized protein n=1 Tax=Saccharum officinarum TaxID=4547 RepID=A0A678T536_SACOF|nr:hypothetical protein SO29L03_000009 [Saccharum officinarum]